MGFRKLFVGGLFVGFIGLASLVSKIDNAPIKMLNEWNRLYSSCCDVLNRARGKEVEICSGIIQSYLRTRTLELQEVDFYNQDLVYRLIGLYFQGYEICHDELLGLEKGYDEVIRKQKSFEI